MRQLAYRRQGSLMIGVAGTGTPSDAEWTAYLGICEQMERDHGDFGSTTALVFSDGGAPNGHQMVALGKLLKGGPAPTARVCDSVLLRVANAVISLINPSLRIFPCRDWRRALDFARVHEPQLDEVLQIVHALGRELDRGALKVLREVPARASQGALP